MFAQMSFDIEACGPVHRYRGARFVDSIGDILSFRCRIRIIGIKRFEIVHSVGDAETIDHLSTALEPNIQRLGHREPCRVPISG